VIASLARTLAEASAGRFHLGLGVGNSALEPIGLRRSTQAEMRSAVTTIRALLGGEAAALGDRTVRLRDPSGPVPLSLAASGPRNQRLAGELGDAAITLSGIEPGSLRRSRELVTAGAVAAGRPADAVRVIASAYCQVTDDLERDARMLKPVCAAIAQKGGRTSLQAAGIDVAVPTSVPEVYPDLLHAENWTNAVEVCSRWVSDQDAVRFAQTFCLFGTAGEVSAGLRAAHEAGADAVFLQHVGSYDLPTELITAYGEEIHPRLVAA
jgi:5,10-methylenetetrahydromethanopterin reductase